jgi:hypothetical protein
LSFSAIALRRKTYLLPRFRLLERSPQQNQNPNAEQPKKETKEKKKRENYKQYPCLVKIKQAHDLNADRQSVFLQ